MSQASLLDYDSNTRIIRDIRVFELKYIPPENYFYKRKELKQIAINIKKYAKFGKPTNMFIYGRAGTGKTASVKLLEREAKERNLTINFYYVSGREYHTEYKIISQLCGRLMDPNKMLEILASKLQGDNIVVIDEADHVRTKDISDLCFQFSRWGEAVPVDGSTVALVLIANKYNLPDIIGAEPHDPVLSSLQPDAVFFKPYNEKELYKILVLRAEEGLVEGSWDDEVLKLIADKCAEEFFGDARYAILTLDKIASECEFQGKDRITTDVDINSAFNYASNRLDEYTVQRLDKQSLLILYSTVICNGEKTVEDIYEKYFDFCIEHGIKSLKKRRVYDYIQSLQSLGLLTLYKLKSKGKGRPKLCVELCVDERPIIAKVSSIVKR